MFTMSIYIMPKNGLSMAELISPPARLINVLFTLNEGHSKQALETRLDVPAWIFLERECSYTCANSVCRYSVGQPLVLNTNVMFYGLYRACRQRRMLIQNRPNSVYRFPRRALALCPHCPQLCMGIQPGARFARNSV